jgi:methionyl aminopeptidase
MRTNDVKLSPNDLCHCGSGLKYKKCHMSQDQTGGAPAEPPKPEQRRDPLILSEAERNGMRKAGAFNAELLDQVRAFVRPGITTKQIDDLVRDYTLSHGHVCATLNYRGSYPAHCCTSVNDVICHGIPGPYELKEGDIVNIDLTTIVEGWHGDQSETFLIGRVSDEALRVVQCAFDAMWLAIGAITPNCKVIEIGRAIKKRAKQDDFSVVEEFFGHGIGRRFHQRPHIPHYPDKRHGGEILKPGMCFTIEPMINVGSWRSVVDSRDGWTAYTVDGKLSAQFEHTILMTETGPEVMTLTKNGPRKGHKFANL